DAIAAIGQTVDRHTPLARIHAASQADADRLAARVREAFTLGDEGTPPPLVHETLCDPSITGETP
ncbi:thymidine phosphorylase, partial [Halomonas sp. OfavH-34-E]|nr:thymidine phosphorylase [Halomonas sp. OfavH-34-E]